MSTEALREIYFSIRQNKMRTALSGFGVSWGILILVVLLGTGKGFRDAVMGMFSVFAQKTMYVYGNSTSQKYRNVKEGKTVRFDEAYLQSLKNRFPEIVAISPQTSSSQLVQNGIKSGLFNIIGVNTDYMRIRILSVKEEGRLFAPGDMKRERDVAIIGGNVASALFGNREALHKHIQVCGVYFRVIGVLKNDDIFSSSEINSVYIPFSSYRRAIDNAPEFPAFCLYPDQVASIQLVPSTSDIERLESNVSIARIEYNTRTVEYERAKRLFATQTISKAEMDEYIRIYLITKENLTSAENQLDILKKGRIASRDISNIVKSSTGGTVIDIPLETGASVIERNNYNPGSTIAVVAETGLYKFRTLIAEHYLKHVSLGDTVTLTFSAYDDFTVKAAVIKISSKGNPENGIMKYMLEAEFVITGDMPVLRSGYSATAELLLNSRDDALSVEEKHVVYRNDSTYLYVLEELGKEPVKKNVALGISDGVYTEITEGVNPGDKIVTNHDKID